MLGLLACVAPYRGICRQEFQILDATNFAWRCSIKQCCFTICCFLPRSCYRFNVPPSICQSESACFIIVDLVVLLVSISELLCSFQIPQYEHATLDPEPSVVIGWNWG